MKLIVGLGNPGRRYASTPHNVGFGVVDELAARNGLKWARARRIDADFADGVIEGTECSLLKPATYMNASGDAVIPLVRGERIDVAEDLLIVLDDVALPLGRLRLRAAGSSGGHRGLDSLILRLGTSQFARLRCGVAPEEEEIRGDLADYVLAKWPNSLHEAVANVEMRAADAVEEWVRLDIAGAMNRVNPR
jgi:peptidyl-tRNA hydrolase, PTH1 family